MLLARARSRHCIALLPKGDTDTALALLRAGAIANTKSAGRTALDMAIHARFTFYGGASPLLDAAKAGVTIPGGD